MKRLIQLLVCLVLFSFVAVQIASAQLVNYGRRDKSKTTPAQKTAPIQKTTVKKLTTSTKEASSSTEKDDTKPFWKIKLPKVKIRTEKRYDVNRDGKLQTAETKIFLRDVIDIVEDKGGFVAKSEILKKYDKNRDGIINRFELKQIKEDTNK